MQRKFVRFISHEIRTPLNTVCMGLELLQAELKAPKGLDGDLKVAQEEDFNFWLNVTDDTNENAHAAVEILNDLLNYDKLETGTLELETAPVLIWDLVEKTISQFGIQAVNRKVELRLDMERPSGETIPDVEATESIDPYNVIGDSIRLSQVLRNVISNALKFTMEDGLIQVTVRYNPTGLPDAIPMLLEDEAVPSHNRAGSISISVKDSGVGLSRDQLDRLFSEGVQFDANRLQHGGGSGLGLSIAKGLVEQHSGTIFADSEGLGHGTTFTVELPLYEFTEEELRKAEDDKDSETAPTAGNSSEATKIGHAGEVHPATAPLKRRILVAEDSASSRKMLIRLLERAGHTCVPAANGKEAVECIKKDMDVKSYDPGHIPIDCVLMDYEMPLLRGPDATKRLRSLGYTGIILGVTGNVLSEDVDFFLRHGANEVMPKPISLKKIQKFWKDFESGHWKPRQSVKHVT
jgi:signal transduction histidine kinase